MDFLCCFQPSYSYDFACSWRKSGNSSQYKRLIYPKWELQPINSYAWRAAPRSSSAPASLGHARAVILWDGFSVEVDGGSNRGANQASLASRTETLRGRWKARRSARRLTVRENPAEIGRSKCRTYLLRPIVVTTTSSAMPSDGKCATSAEEFGPLNTRAQRSRWCAQNLSADRSALSLYGWARGWH